MRGMQEQAERNIADLNHQTLWTLKRVNVKPQTQAFGTAVIRAFGGERRPLERGAAPTIKAESCARAARYHLTAFPAKIMQNLVLVRSEHPDRVISALNRSALYARAITRSHSKAAKV